LLASAQSCHSASCAQEVSRTISQGAPAASSAMNASALLRAAKKGVRISSSAESLASRLRDPAKRGSSGRPTARASAAKRLSSRQLMQSQPSLVG